MMVHLLAWWAGRDPAELEEERVREFFLHLIRNRQYAPQSIRQARAALTAFYMEMRGRTDWMVFASVKTKDLVKLPLVCYIKFANGPTRTIRSSPDCQRGSRNAYKPRNAGLPRLRAPLRRSVRLFPLTWPRFLSNH